jgi:DNA-binding NarL/FixJ family response regulator
VGLQEALGKSSAYRCTSVTNGGEALDHASQHKFHMALVCERLPDLPWGMVVKTLRAQAPESIVMVFSHPGTLPGRVVIAEENRDIDLVPQLDRPEQLVEAIHQVHEGYMAKARERHYLQAFRAEHLDFLKRYGELRQKLTALLPRTK